MTKLFRGKKNRRNRKNRKNKHKSKKKEKEQEFSNIFEEVRNEKLDGEHTKAMPNNFKRVTFNYEK